MAASDIEAVLPFSVYVSIETLVLLPGARESVTVPRQRTSDMQSGTLYCSAFRYFDIISSPFRPPIRTALKPDRNTSGLRPITVYLRVSQILHTNQK
jgi:hypothetical protein